MALQISPHPSVQMIYRRPLAVTEEIIEIPLVNFIAALVYSLDVCGAGPVSDAASVDTRNTVPKQNQEIDGKAIDESQTCLACIAGGSKRSVELQTIKR